MAAARSKLLVAAASLAVAALGAWLYARMSAGEVVRERGQALNRLAWERSYVERGVDPPPNGPREGYWGSRLGPSRRDPGLGWYSAPADLPGLVSVDERGVQHYRSPEPAAKRVMILGGSVAWGAYASTEAETYFHRLGEALAERGAPAHVDVVAAEAWKSSQEYEAFVRAGPHLEPDVVVFLDGLNDLTNGATADALYGAEVPTRDGSPWTPLYHAHDYDARVARYLERIRAAAEAVRANGARALVALQPALFERERLTPIERKLLEGSLVPHASARALTDAYQRMRAGLRELETRGLLRFVDCSRAFDGERHTTFADLWHFSDFGHRILAERLAGPVAELLEP